MPIENPDKNQNTDNNTVATTKTTMLNLKIAHIAIKVINTGMLSGKAPKSEISENSRVSESSLFVMLPFAVAAISMPLYVTGVVHI